MGVQTTKMVIFAKMGVQKVVQKVVILGVQKRPQFAAEFRAFLEQNPFCLRARARARAREGPQKWPLFGVRNDQG